MERLHWSPKARSLAVIIFVTWIISSNAKDLRYCPVGFEKSLKEPDLCYRKKEPEVFQDLYKGCSRNEFHLALHKILRNKEPNVVWTQYKTAYPGGPFVDMSFTSNFGHKLDSDYTVEIPKNGFEVEEDLCLVIDPVLNYTAVRCDEKHYRYCMVRIKSDEDKDIMEEQCKDIKDSYNFLNPVPTCLSVLSGTKDKGKTGSPAAAPVRATWTQAQELCGKKGSSLLNRGWRYINEFLSTESKRIKTYPLGIIMTSDHSLLRYDASGDHAEIPRSEWQFQSPLEGSSLLGALSAVDGATDWQLVDSSYVFYDVLCERTLRSPNVSLQLNIDPENKLTLNVSHAIKDKDLYCITDATPKFPNKIKAHLDAHNNFILTPKSEDGYYWCIYRDPVTYKTVETNKVLFLRDKESLVNVYAIKFRSTNKSYDSDNLESRLDKWLKQLTEYIYYTSKYYQIKHRLPDGNDTEGILQKFFNNSLSSVEGSDEEVTRNFRLKRYYLDGRTVLVHAELSAGAVAARPGGWRGLRVLHMRPAYYCPPVAAPGGQAVPRAPLGKAVAVGCATYKCVGDFNEGAQWAQWARPRCAPAATVALHVASVSLLMPTLPPPTRIMDKKHRDSSEESQEKRPPKPTTTPCPEEDTGTHTVGTVTATTEEVLTTEITTTEITTTEGATTEITTPEVTTEVAPTTPLPTEPTPTPPEDQLQQIMDDLDRLVNDTVSMDNITVVFEQVNNILDGEDDLEIPGRLLHLLDELGSVVDLNGSHTGAAVGANVALLVGDAQPDKPIRGLTIAARDIDQFTNDSFAFMTESPDSQTLEADKNEAVVLLPPSVAESARRISFVVFRNDRAFRAAAADAAAARVNSRVLSINVHNLTSFARGEVIDIHMRPMTTNISRSERRSCGYWHFAGAGGRWAQAGCRLVRAARPGALDACRCDHLTHFAEILVPRSVFSERDEAALEVLSVAGCCLSILGLAVVGLTAATFRGWRRDFNNKVWLQLCASISVMATCFLVVVFAKFEHYDVPCMLVGIALHYSVLASFCWMVVAAVVSYRRLVLVFTREASHKLLRASAFAYGAPCAVVGVLLSAAPQSYAGRYEEKTPSAAFCYPTGLGLWLAVYAPVAVMILANWTLFGLIVRSVFASRRIQRHGDSNEALRCASVSCLLVFLFGLPWVFGLFAYNIGAAYLFTVTATFQGFILFLFFVLGNKKTRDMWLNKLKIKQTRKVPVTSSTFTNRSVGYRGGHPPATAEGKESRPRSLTSTDDSKFS